MRMFLWPDTAVSTLHAANEKKQNSVKKVIFISKTTIFSSFLTKINLIAAISPLKCIIYNIFEHFTIKTR